MPEITKPGGLSYEVVLEDAKVTLWFHKDRYAVEFQTLREDHNFYNI